MKEETEDTIDSKENQEADLEADLTRKEIEQKDLLHKQKELTNVTN